MRMSSNDELSPFDILPNEIFCEILTNLDTKDRAIASKVCKRFYSTVHSNLPNFGLDTPYLEEGPSSKYKDESNHAKIKLEKLDYLSKFLTMQRLADYTDIYYKTDDFAKRVIDELAKCQQSFKCIRLFAHRVSEDIISYYYNAFISPPRLNVCFDPDNTEPLHAIPIVSNTTKITLRTCVLGPNATYPPLLSELEISSVNRIYGLWRYFLNLTVLENLQKLTLKDFEFDYQDNYDKLVQVLSSLPKLENLELKSCKFPTSLDRIDLEIIHLKHLEIMFNENSNVLLESLVSSSRCLTYLEFYIEFLYADLSMLARISPWIKSGVEIKLTVGYKKPELDNESPETFFSNGGKIPKRLGDCMTEFMLVGFDFSTAHLNEFIEVDAFRNCRKITIYHTALDDSAVQSIISCCTKLRLFSVYGNFTLQGMAKVLEQYCLIETDVLTIEWLNTSKDHINKLYDEMSANETFLEKNKVQVVHKVGLDYIESEACRVEVHYENGKRAVVRNYAGCQSYTTGTISINP